MGAVAAELQSLGHRPNFFYLQHAMGLASSMGLGIALARPDRQVVVFDGDGSILMNLGGLTTLARYRPRNLVHVVFDNESLLSVGGFPTATATGSDLAGIAAAAGVPRTETVSTLDAFTRAFDEALARRRPDDDRRQGRGGRPDAPTSPTCRCWRTASSSRGACGRERARRSRSSSTRSPRGSLTVVDLTQPLGPATPVIGLPPMFAASPGVTIDVISRYDDKGPAWYWNTLRFGEHTGTHFDAPVHWITGKDLPDNACDTIPPRRFVGPACVIDVTADVAREPGLPADGRAASRRGSASTGGFRRARGCCCAPAGARGPIRPRSSTSRADGPHSPGFDARASRLLAHDRDVLGVGVETIGTDAGQAGTFDPPFPNHTIMHGAGQVRAGEPVQPRSAAADRRGRDRRAAEDRATAAAARCASSRSRRA